MQVMDEAYSNFVNSINSDQTRRLYEYSLSKFLKYCNTDLDSFLRLSQQQTSNLIVNYLVSKKITRQYKLVIFSAIKLACEMNDVILNWKKLHRFIKSEKTDNSINGKDRGYTISNREFYRLKNEVKENTQERLNLIASKEFLAQHLERIDTLRTILKEKWANYHLEKNPFKKVQILEKIEENQVYLSSFYDSTRYVLQQAVTNNKKELKIEEN